MPRTPFLSWRILEEMVSITVTMKGAANKSARIPHPSDRRAVKARVFVPRRRETDTFDRKPTPIPDESETMITVTGSVGYRDLDRPEPTETS